MTKNEVQKHIRAIFKKKGFLCRNTHFYYDTPGDFMIVFGIQSSVYGGHCYLERGYCIKSINRYSEYPKFYELGLNCGRISGPIEYEGFGEEWIRYIENKVDELLPKMLELAGGGKDALIGYYLERKDTTGVLDWYVLGDYTAEYFGLTRADVKYHFCDPDV